MDRRVAGAAAALLLAMLAIPVASADCTTHGGPVGVQVCEDDNGNGTPDRVRVWTPVADAEHDEGSCGGCPFETEADAGAEGARAEAEVHCAFGGDPQCTAGEVNAKVPSARVKVWFFTIDEDDDEDDGDGDEDPEALVVCVSVGAAGTWVGECNRIPLI